MIAYVKGKIEDKQENFVVIDVSNIGYKVFCSSNVLDSVLEGQEIKLFTHLYLKEGIMDLYGFLDYNGLKLFKTLLGVSGIGPKAGLAIVSLGTREQIEKAVETNNMEFFDKVKGIGRKKIQKIILELTGKLKEIKKTSSTPAQTDEALSALVSLGFTSQDAKSALLEIPDAIQDTEEKIAQALKLLGK
jgi:Holliday junction DNA helicase RuvA